MALKKRTKGHKRSIRRLAGITLKWVTLLLLVVLGASIGLMGGLVYSMSRLVPENMDALDFRPSDATRIYSSDGVLLARLFKENREVVKMSDIPESLKEATIAIEDKRFYQHQGFDPIGIVRAAYRNIRGGGFEQGGSTITQQLARNVYLSKTKTVSRKVQELALATAIERKYTKEQILEMYLNQIYYGSGAYGVESAARTYFGKSVGDLTLAESALIAGLPQRPSGYSPHTNMKAAIGRRNVVLRQMAEQGLITEQEAEEAISEEVNLVPRRGNARWKAPYFVTYVIQQVGSQYGEETLYQAGLRIYTTLDYKMQEAAEKAIRDGVRGNSSKGVGQGALVSLDPETGYVRAMVGGVDFMKNQFNVVTQGRPQPGSTFKPIVYAAALENGWSPRDTIVDEKVFYRGQSKGPWPVNYDGKYHGRVTLTTALAFSYNVPAVKLARAVGVDEIIRYARAMGVYHDLPRDLTIALGSASLSPMEMASVYCVFANGGDSITPQAVRRITTADGGGIFTSNPSRKRAIRTQTASALDDMLQEVVTRGTGRPIRGRVDNARGKTGTTNELKHAWFIGYTPELVTAVWLGNDTPMPMRAVSGGGSCGPVWASFMQAAVPLQRAYNRANTPQSRQHQTASEPDERPEPRPERPQRVTRTICDLSGLLAGPACPATHQESFERGSAPTVRCDIHFEDSIPAGEPGDIPIEPPPTDNTNPRGETPEPVSQQLVNVLVCTDSNLLANPNCPHVARKRLTADKAPTSVCGRH